MSHTDSNFEEIFQAFKEKFPPAADLSHATIRMTTQEVQDMVLDFYPEVVWPRSGVTHFMTAQGYKYSPVEENGRVRYYWLVSKGQEN